MMLLIKIPSSFFKQFDNVIKHFLWDGKRARINLNKLIAPKEKGGLGFPDCRLYHLLFILTKIAKYWNQEKDKTHSLLLILQILFFILEMFGLEFIKYSNYLTIYRNTLHYGITQQSVLVKR